jgi:hypothetical protein
MCRLDLAPEAPWRCPADCPSYERKIAGGGWVQGSLAHRFPNEPPELDDSHIEMLDTAEDIINTIGHDVVADVKKEREAKNQSQSKRRWWWPFGR